MRALMVLLFIFVVGSVSISVLAGMQNAPDAFANHVSTSTNKVENSENAVGAPDGNYADLLKEGDNQYLELDMGEGEEGTGGLVLHYHTDKNVRITVQFMGGEKNSQPLFSQEVQLMADNATVLVNYPPTLLPYRYVRLLTAEKPYSMDAIQAETFRPDSDGDGLPDEWEQKYGLNRFISTGVDGPYGDWDQDDMNNKDEYALGIDPRKVDSDGDGIPDHWERANSLAPGNADGEDGAFGDPDKDGLGNLQEYSTGTNPQEEDTDKDDLRDNLEISLYTDPTNADSDDDNLKDGQEIAKGTNPNQADTDGDHLPDGWECDYELNPLDGMGDNGSEGDPDQDGLKNQEEFEHGTHPGNADTDSDGLSDAEEINAQTNPSQADTDEDGLPDGWEHDHNFGMKDASGENGADGDPDQDNVKNIEEYESGTNPRNPDTDLDGLPDFWELKHCLDPLSSVRENGPDGDPDGDGKTNFVEMGTGEPPKDCPSH